jgi:cyclopropane fatty-acyl-phospholipid synthase-like methyltransferase
VRRGRYHEGADTPAADAAAADAAEADTAEADTAEAVRAYYDSNTGLFLRMGIGQRTLAIRRAVWANGVRSLEEAVNYVNSLIAAEAVAADSAAASGAAADSAKESELRFLDIGCGVGGSLFFLAAAVPAPFRGIGVTISPRQAEVARRQARARGLSARCSFLAGDFTRLSGLPSFHLAFAIESFVHFTSPAAFFASASARLRPGGRLVVVDDFLSANARNPLCREDRVLIEAFRQGWLLSSLCTADRAVQAARDCGLCLVEDRDLSGYLSQLPLGARMGRWAVSVMRALPVPWPYWRSSVGSLAQAVCRRAGLVDYRFLVFEKRQA